MYRTQGFFVIFCLAVCVWGGGGLSPLLCLAGGGAKSLRIRRCALSVGDTRVIAPYEVKRSTDIL